MKIGCLFGSFDPPHLGHVLLAKYMREHQGLDQVWLVVTPQNPFKQDRKLSPEKHRLAMTHLAVQGLEGLSASGLELDMPRPNYTADTLTFMRKRWPQHRFSLIIGSDNLASLHEWKDASLMLEKTPVLVYPRPGLEEHLAQADLLYHPSVTVVPDAPQTPVSSTGIRVRLRNWHPVDGLLDPKVLAYIRQNGLYAG
ncbi:MAG: nicotinate (nicotinamide) nucleotide adenylyltransferase [Flavobacteriales bacterium]|jgi:nicotinate-nucleotide adenylyltransferase|nr:nicotinate (nicotinamide) nucleotide adenylyltransferase [Flavobacteriales bacterium]MBK6892087.1 nicotinate (nicotinamide) nucleotide adenylyltransferase [Flavobacteriales bacterium]MBK7246222.1 nicotinate (nicotinamide) nucleotide adenylyltransferase [Flavobacteriales bacterium]MBK7286203.1 nicotinate (nicotinamide) nucleotide adenylyltransferase [Flavobacteriales bacterium]MBK9060012.1 nicotinate (nicotinamide) nucleotide adenylyltransferase [Flavobacteriales bacterium]